MSTKTNRPSFIGSTLTKIRKTSHSNKLIAVVIAVGVAVAGYLVLSTQAANLFASLDFSNASLSGVTRVNDSKASGGKALQFGEKQTTPTPDPDPDPNPPTIPPSDGAFPTPQTTGPRTSNLTASGSITSSATGQVIERKHVTGKITIKHDNVIVRDTKISGTSTYMITTDKKSNGQCPVNVRFEYIEIDGSKAAENDIPIYSSCGNMTIDHAYVHKVGRSSRLTNNMAVTNSYIFSNRTGDSGAHRGAVGINGGSNNVIKNNVLRCQGTGCSASIPNYGDFAQVTNLLIEHNLLATTGSYCAYGGSLASKPYPNGTNIDFINNHFSTEFFPTCGRYGPISGFANNVRGNEWRGNVWHDGPNAGKPVNP